MMAQAAPTRQVARLIAVIILALLIPLHPARAESGQSVDAVLDLLRIEDTIDVVQEESLEYASDIARDMIPEADRATWAARSEAIYDKSRMRELVADTMRQELAETDLAPAIAFFESETGQRLVALELAARRAFLEPGVEAEAQDRYAVLSAEGSRLTDQIGTLISDSDLIDLNVTGGLNAELMFYRGLVDGGALDLAESQILDDVWGQREALRRSSRDWLHSFMLLAYQPVEAADLDAYIAFYRTPEGRDLNRAIFAGFNHMYEELSYRLGEALAREMESTRL